MFIELLEGAAGMVLGALLYSAGFRAGRKQRLAGTTAVCPCKHHIGEHEDMVGKCHGVRTVTEFNLSGEDVGPREVPCTCQHYAGPELISSLTLRPVIERGEAHE